jgi:SAM-dependent methyltransferase
LKLVHILVYAKTDSKRKGFKMKIRTLAWVLPRPGSAYRGSFPKGFEEKLSKLLRLKGKMVLQPFGGCSKLGIRIDLNKNVKPDIVADAHYLPIKNNIFDCVILDPPYSEEYSEKLFGIKQNLKLKVYLREAIRVLKPNGFLVFYHIYPIPCPKGLRWYARILIEHRMFHKLRWCGIWQKGFKTMDDYLHDLQTYVYMT